MGQNFIMEFIYVIPCVHIHHQHKLTPDNTFSRYEWTRNKQPYLQEILPETFLLTSICAQNICLLCIAILHAIR